MENAKRIPITSTELSTLWMTYQRSSMLKTMLLHFVANEEDETVKNILITNTNEFEKHISEIQKIFNDEKAAIPIAFNDNDIYKDVPMPFDNMFGMILIRFMAKVGLGLDSLSLSMSYRKDIIEFYQSILLNTQNIYKESTVFLLEQGILARPPYVSMPKEVTFIKDKEYMKGIKLWGNKRSLNCIEAGFITEALEFNIFGMQLMTGFAQVAKEGEVRKYFVEGKELAKKIVSDLSGLLLQSDIQPPSTWTGNATDSVIPPFSDKLMMYCSNLLSNYAIGHTALGASFSLRNDLPAILTLIATETVAFAKKGGELMIEQKWMEEPPQMQDRNQLIDKKE